MTRWSRSLWIAGCGALLIGGTALASEPVASGGQAAATAAAESDPATCTDKAVEAQQREAALKDLGERLSALPPAPSYRPLNRTGLNYGPRREPAPAPAAPPAKPAP